MSVIARDCPKCGHKEAARSYCPGDLRCDLFDYKPGEHLHLHCRGCHYAWSEPCLPPRAPPEVQTGPAVPPGGNQRPDLPPDPKPLAAPSTADEFVALSRGEIVAADRTRQGAKDRAVAQGVDSPLIMRRSQYLRVLANLVRAQEADPAWATANPTGSASGFWSYGETNEAEPRSFISNAATGKVLLLKTAAPTNPAYPDGRDRVECWPTADQIRLMAHAPALLQAVKNLVEDRCQEFCGLKRPAHFQSGARHFYSCRSIHRLIADALGNPLDKEYE